MPLPPQRGDSLGRGLRATMSDYAARVRAFQPNARLYLLNVVITGAAMGVFRLLFNFYVLSLGYNEALVGNLIKIGRASCRERG